MAVSAFYKISYGMGFHPWEDLVNHEPFADALLALIDRVEAGRIPWGVELAARGWTVTGVDNIAKALRRAEERIREAGVEMRLVHADVTRLRQSGVGSGYDLVVDTGTFHGLTPAQRPAMGREVAAITTPTATVILDCFSPRRRGPLPRGCTRADVEDAFPGWEMTAAVDADTDPEPIARLFKFGEMFYALRRQSSTV
jgi:hypothetical protein